MVLFIYLFTVNKPCMCAKYNIYVGGSEPLAKHLPVASIGGVADDHLDDGRALVGVHADVLHGRLLVQPAEDHDN